MECENLTVCKFLEEFKKEKEYWYYKYCGNIKLAKKCERLRWCECKGTKKPPINYQPDGKFHS